MAGDQVGFYNGSLSFSATDVALPGNGALPVAVQRRYVVSEHRPQDLPFADWELDLPNVHGVFAAQTGWVNAAGNASRCTVTALAAAKPPAVEIGTNFFLPEEYWQGHQLNIPGRGGQELLLAIAGAQRPAGGSWYWVTNDWTYVGCLPTIRNGIGEGFYAVTADGTKYWFDWMASTGVEGMLAKANQIDAKSSNVTLYRNRIALYATRVEDRFGNWVTYSYANAAGEPVRLTAIDASDGRRVTLSYNAQGDIASVSAHGRSWTYQYNYSGKPTLTAVVLPDGQRWTIDFAALTGMGILYVTQEPGEPWRDCLNPPDIRWAEASATGTGTITHPSGARAEFTVAPRLFGRSNVPEACDNVTAPYNDPNDDLPAYPVQFYSIALLRKRLSGPGLPTAEWNYSYGGVFGFAPVSGYSYTEVTGPEGSYVRYTFGNRYRDDEGLLLQVEQGSGPGALLRTRQSTYQIGASGQPFPGALGYSPQPRGDSFTAESLRPQKTSTITQEGATFSLAVNQYEAFGRPASVTRASSLGASRTELTQYHDNLSQWVLGQVAKVTVTDPEPDVVVSEAEYDPATAQLLRVYGSGTPTVRGRLEQALAYHADGTVRTVTDGRNNTTTLSGWKRGIPQTITHPDGSHEAAGVDDNGWITWVEDETRARTCYAYDAMGRITQVTYPSEAQAGVCDTGTWAPTTQSFVPVAASEYGIPAGHWKQTVSTGNGRTVTYFDAFWRPLVEERFDAADPANTRSLTVKRYDAAGRLAFQSYPRASLGSYADTGLTGTRTFYDALDRVTRTEQDSELGVLATTTEYLPGFQTRLTNPRGHATTTSYLAWDQPTTEFPTAIIHPEGARTVIARDVFGKPTVLTRRNADGSVLLTRSYAYNAAQELCKQVEPETRATVMSYDAAGNLAWSASGLELTAPGQCETGSVPADAKVVRSYDARNRLTGLAFPDRNGDQTWSYWPDGLVKDIVTYNDGGATTVVNRYSYNRRRLLTSETLEQPGLYSWSLGYGYTANGHLGTVTSPGLSVDYAPNALGQPTRAGTYATGVSYHPNGGMAQFTYGNGIVHTLAQNARGLPERSRDAYGSTAVLDDSYDYDANGNVAAISDGLPGNRGNRDMTYDGLDRLKTVVSPMYGATGASYAYDVLDNLTRVTVGGALGRDHWYCYDQFWRLTNVKTGGCGGASVIGLGYDVRGNLNNKNGQLYRFDHGNRLREAVNKELYRYDGHGRRIQATHPTQGNIYSFYGQDGVLRYQEDYRTGKVSRYVHLNGSLVARVTGPTTSLSPPTLSAPSVSNDGSFTVSWAAVAGASRYRLEESVNNGAWIHVAESTATSWGTSGRANGSYRYRARSCHLDCSAYSGIATVTVEHAPTGVPVLTAPELSSTGSYTVSWTTVPATTRYELEESANGGAWMQVYSGAGTSLALAGKAQGSYSYRVRACSTSCAAYSTTRTVQVVIPPDQAPTLSGGGEAPHGHYTVSWTTVPRATGYQLEESANGGAWALVQDAAGTSRSYSGKPAGSYSYRARGCNAGGCGPYSNTVTVQPVYPPVGKPTLSAPASSAGSHTVSWTGVATATRYEVEERPVGGSWARIHDGAALSVGVSGRGPGTYEYRGRACNAAGCGPDSEVVSVGVVAAVPPTPTGLSAFKEYEGGWTCTVTWDPAAGATRYELREGGSAVVYSGPDTAYVRYADCSLPFAVRACNANGCSGWSGEVTPVRLAAVGRVRDWVVLETRP